MIIKHQLKVIVLSLLIAGLSLPSLHAQTDTLAQHRKKVGLVLCGGGAKGAAHVGVLKVLEKAGIPIDYIAGTSMGAIIGGLYAAGYCANDLDSLISAQNWTALLSDQVDASSIASAHRQVGDKYLLSVPISLSNKKVELPTGAVRGRNVLNLFNELTIGYHDSISFENLTIPFSAVACDLVTGKAVVMNSGSLATAMRASMSIPGVFEPVRIGDQVLVDGGVVNNFPADVLREMGAEIVIGVELSQGLQDAETVNSIMGMVNQLTVMLELETHHKNLALIDCLIAPDVNPYTAASFTPDALRTLIHRGEIAATIKWDELLKLKQLIGPIDSAEVRHASVINISDTLSLGEIVFQGATSQESKMFSKIVPIKPNSRITIKDLRRSLAVLSATRFYRDITYSLRGKNPYTLTFQCHNKVDASLRVGIRMDSEEMQAILLNFAHRSPIFLGAGVDLTARLSRNPYVKISMAFGYDLLKRVNFSYKLQYNDLRYYYEDKRVFRNEYPSHEVDLSTTGLNYRYRILTKGGLRMNYYHYDKEQANLFQKNTSLKPVGLLSYYLSLQRETLDDKTFPTKGFSINLMGMLHTDNFVSYDDGDPIGDISLRAFRAFSFGTHFTLIPQLRTRILTTEKAPLPLMNASGVADEKYMPQQFAFVGTRHVSLFENNLAAVQCDFRYSITSKHHITAKMGVLQHTSEWEDFFTHTVLFGAGVEYTYRSILGPISLQMDTNNERRKLHLYFNFGYMF